MAARSDSDGRLPSERVGRYELLFPIGTGGMATVYLAHARGAAGFQRDVALKLLHPHLRAEPHKAEELIDEARLASRIRHPNVVQVLDLGDDPVGVFLIMDYVEGDTLSGIARKMTADGDRLPRPVAMRILSDALAGLHAAHELADEKGAPLLLVHRDFSPSNILVGVDGVTRLSDFGIARSRARTVVTQEGFIKGKLAYMSPEQVRGQHIDRRSDVWAAGVVAWELVTGRRLHAGNHDTETILSIVSQDPPRARSVDPGVPEALDEAIAGALTSDLARRTSTAEELRRRLLAGAGCGVADASEVSGLVGALAGPMLVERRRRAQEIVELRERVGELARGAEADVAPLTPDVGPGRPSASPLLSTQEAVTLTAPQTRPSRAARPRGTWAFVGAALVVGGLVALGVARRAPAPAEPASTGSALASPAEPAASSSVTAPAPEPFTAPNANALTAGPTARSAPALRPPRKPPASRTAPAPPPSVPRSAASAPSLARDPLERSP